MAGTCFYRFDSYVSDEQTYTAWRPAVRIALLAPTVGIGLFAFVVLMMADGMSLPDVLRRGATAWLFAGGSGLQIEGKTIGIIPIGVVALQGGITYFVAAWSIRAAPVDPKVFAPVTAGVAGSVSAILAVVVSTDAIAVPMFRAAIVTFLFVGSQAGLAALHRSKRVWFGMPARWWPIAEAVAASMMFFFGVAVLVLLLLLATSLQESANMWATLYPEGQGIVLGLALVLAFPTAVLWTGAVLLGTPVSLGGDAYVNLAATQVERLPILPLLTAIPEPGPHPGWAMVLGAVPLAAGFFGGSFMRRRTQGNMDWNTVLKNAVITGASAGLGVSALIATSAGGVGVGALNTAGPTIWLVAVVAVSVFTLGAVIGASASHYRLTRVHH